MAVAPNAEERRHHERVRELGCVVTRRSEPTIHHCHGGSLRGLVSRGGAVRGSHWIVLPLALELHSMGQYAIDGSFGVNRWERMFGTQLYHLCRIREQLGYDFFERAGLTVPLDLDPLKYPED